MSRSRRSRFTNWTTGSDASEASEMSDIDTVADNNTVSDSAVADDSGVSPSSADPGVSPSLNDLLVGDDASNTASNSASNASDTSNTDSSPPLPAQPYDGRMLMVAIEAVTPNSGQPRRRFDETALVALANSIAELGVLQPIIVRPADSDDESYELVAGERRWRAARRAGLTHVPALVRRVDDLRSLEEAIVENLHRVDLNSLEEANAFQQLIDDFDLTQEDVATRVGKSRSAVANTLRLLQLPGSIQRMVVDGELSAGHARTLLSEPNLARQRQLAARIISEEMSVRQAEDLVRELTESGSMGRHHQGDSDAGKADKQNKAQRRSKSAGALEVENHLADVLDTRIRVSERAKGGSITIEFADGEDLDRIYRLFVGPNRRRQDEDG